MSDVGRVMLRHIQSEGQPAMTTTPRSSADFAGTRKSAWSATDAIKNSSFSRGRHRAVRCPPEPPWCDPWVTSAPTGGVRFARLAALAMGRAGPGQGLLLAALPLP